MYKVRIVPKNGKTRVVTVSHHRRDVVILVKKALLATGISESDIKECTIVH